MANMSIYDLPASSNWSKMLRDYNLLNLFCKMLVPGMAQVDLLLEIVMIISTIASDLQVLNALCAACLRCVCAQKYGSTAIGSKGLYKCRLLQFHCSYGVLVSV